MQRHVINVGARRICLILRVKGRGQRENPQTFLENAEVKVNAYKCLRPKTAGSLSLNSKLHGAYVFPNVT